MYKNKIELLIITLLVILNTSILEGKMFNITKDDFLKLKNKPFLTTKEEPRRDAFSAGMIKANKEYRIYRKQSGWYQVKTDDGYLGWVPEEFVEILSSTIPESEQKNKIKITAPAINIREEPSEASWSIGMVKQGDHVVVLEESNEWYKINYNGTEGWIPVRGVEKLSTSIVSNKQMTATKQHMIKVKNATSVNIYEEPSESSWGIGLIEKGVKLTVLDEKNGWYKINHKGVEGWIKLQETLELITVAASDQHQKSEQYSSAYDSKSSFSGYAKWICWGAGAVTGVLAANYYQQGNNTFQDYKKATSTDDAVQLYDETISFDKKRDTMMIVAGINVGLGVIFHLLDNRSRIDPNRFSINIRNVLRQDICLNVKFHF